METAPDNNQATLPTEFESIEAPVVEPTPDAEGHRPAIVVGDRMMNSFGVVLEGPGLGTEQYVRV